MLGLRLVGGLRRRPFEELESESTAPLRLFEVWMSFSIRDGDDKGCLIRLSSPLLLGLDD